MPKVARASGPAVRQELPRLTSSTLARGGFITDYTPYMSTRLRLS